MADKVARHLVAAGQIIDEDSELALQHAIAARRLASRIAVVREAVGLAAYAAGDWTTAIAELRTYHRMTGRQTHLAELADCERALGRPERAIDLFRGADVAKLEKSGAIELLIVAAGARGDLGQHDAAVAMLQVKELTTEEDAEWAARLRYAYADALLAAGRREEAREWFARAASVDEDQLTDAAERLLELDGVAIEGDDDDADEETEAALGEGGPETRSEDDDDSEGTAAEEFDDEDEDDEPVAVSDADDDVEDDEDDEPVAVSDADEDESAELSETDVNTDALDAEDEKKQADEFSAKADDPEQPKA
ncbi:Replicase polyprotein 1ab [Actinoplanes sp. OR16]|uniref:Replicase polyprotein 1ab n=1 Tax=Actinoplanes sp. OR16 TaxID=946334 RepID=UPI000FDA4A42|nr:Replicase polyprotein 1ab [Actinoplanes sp. OR16]